MGRRAPAASEPDAGAGPATPGVRGNDPRWGFGRGRAPPHSFPSESRSDQEGLELARRQAQVPWSRRHCRWVFWRGHGWIIAHQLIRRWGLMEYRRMLEFGEVIGQRAYLAERDAERRRDSVRAVAVDGVLPERDPMSGIVLE